MPITFKKTKKKVPIVAVRKTHKKGFFGSTDFDENNKPRKVEINIKDHYKKGKLDKQELASTIKHELTHVKFPNMTEKEVYKRTAKTKIAPQERSKLLSKLSYASSQKVEAMKRKYKVDGKPGDMISKVNESRKINRNNSPISKKKLSIMGLV